LSKRRKLCLDSESNDLRLKRQSLDLQDDVNWIKAEIGDITTQLRDIKGCMTEIAEHLQGIDHI
jgi:hypothetical protein